MFRRRSAEAAFLTDLKKRRDDLEYSRFRAMLLFFFVPAVSYGPGMRFFFSKLICLFRTVVGVSDPGG